MTKHIAPFPVVCLRTLLVGTIWTATAQAQSYPNRPITVIVPFASGGLTDVPVRVLTAMLQERIGQNIVVENKPGGSGTIGGAVAARAKPDGYTLFANSVADTQNLHYIPVPYNAIDDFAMIGMIVEGPPLVLIIDAKLPYKTLAELVCRCEGKSEQAQLRHLRSGHLACDRPDAAQFACQDRDRGRALSRLGRGGPQRRGRRDPRRLRLLFPGQAACGRWQGACARGREPAQDRDLVRGADDGGARLSAISIIAASSASPRLPRRRRRHRLPQQAAERGRPVRGVPQAHGSARHDRAGRATRRKSSSRSCDAKPHARGPWPSSPATSRWRRSAECAGMR